MNKLKIGLLPLYIKLYDDYFQQLEERVDSFYHMIATELGKKKLDVVTAPICRIKSEFAAAVGRFEAEGVDAIVTLHLAYSPSLESADVLAATKLPIIVLDTTPTFDYSPGQNPEELLYNHGIHGVQDMCNLLIRNGKSFLIEAGHWAESDVLERIAEDVKASRIARNLQNAKVGRLGNTFEGMGDFDVPIELMRSTIGIETIAFDLQDGSSIFEAVDEKEIIQEMEMDKSHFLVGELNPDVHKQSTSACLAVRKLIEQHELTAFTVNFLEITKQSGLSSMPFLEASKAMARGIGYAGEGDALTAALVGALLSVYPETTFTEMFCPDWKNNRIFLSHMGEMNISLAAQKPILKEMNFPFTDAENPVVAYGRFRGGAAVYVNLAPGINQTFTWILSPVDMLEAEGEDRMEGSVRGWFEPTIPVADFLAAYSKHGGTHHGAIVYGDALKVMEELGALMGWNTVIIK